MSATIDPAMPAAPAQVGFRHLAPGLGSGEPCPEGWRSLAECPMVVLVGVTGVGKSTTIAALSQLGAGYSLLPDRRWLTNELIIAAMQDADHVPPHPVTDRRLRFELTRRYRARFPGGMAHALAQLRIDPLAHATVLLFDGLRGAEEVTHAATLLPEAHFAVLHAPDFVRVQRLLNRRDAFDQAATAAPPGEAAHACSLADLGIEDASNLLQPGEEAALVADVHRGAVDPGDLRAKLAIVVEERRNYDPQAAIDALTAVAPDRTLLVDTTQATPEEAAQRIAARIRALSANRPKPTRSSPPFIEQIRTTVFRLPMLGALRWGKASTLSEVQHVLVEVRLSDGSAGQAEAPPRPTIYGETVGSILHVIEAELAPRIHGMAVAGPEGDEPIWQADSLRRIQARLHEVKNNHTAIGALDMAIHDALAQSRGLDLARHLGAVRPRLKVSYILGMGDRDAVLEEAQQVVARGVRVLKVKVGRTWAEDLARIAELQALLGADVALYADANECLTAEEAPYILAQLAAMGLLYCEEPLPVELIRERAAIRRGDYLPVIADDSTFSLRDLQRELALDTFHILNIKTARTGYTESGQMLDLAHRHGKGIMVGSQASAGLGTARAAAFAALASVGHPSELSFFLKLREDILTKPLVLEDGYLRLADALAVQVDRALLAAATVHPRGW